MPAALARAATAAAADPGQPYGKYQLLERIAVGGVSEVYRATSTSAGGFAQEVALKRILPHLSTDAEFVSLFLDEAKLAISLSHRNIVPVFDFGRIENNYCIAMELVDGRDLTQVLIKQSRRRRAVPLEAAFYIASETLRGLEHAHTRRGADGRPLGVVHRDVSPHNILVSFDGEVKITGFGLAKALRSASSTPPGAMFGKLAYMSPEQASGNDIDARSDVYGAGITLYETLTGRRLFYSEDPARTLAKVRNPRVPPPSRYNALVPPAVDTLALRALAKDPEARFESAREFGAAIEAELHRIAPGFNNAHLSGFMKELFEDEVGPERFILAVPCSVEEPPPRFPPARPSNTATEVPRHGTGEGDRLDDPILAGLAAKMKREPNLWTLVALAERMDGLARRTAAERALRAAGMKFAQNGLLVQAMATYVRLRSLCGWSAHLAAEVEGLRTLPGTPNVEVFRRLEPVPGDALGLLLRNVVGRQGPADNAHAVLSPLFSLLEGAELANLVRLLELKEVPASTTIVDEGASADCLYFIACGRVLTYRRNFDGRKVYLSSLSDGDCFGEFSFFTGEPRAATVETLEKTVLFEIRKLDFETILDRAPGSTDPLLRFYKSRVVATLLVKSAVFGGLGPRERQELADKLTLDRVPAQRVILREGDDSDGFYLVKNGEVEVYSEKKGYAFLDRLKSGDFFGEIAALKGTPRTASVRALGPCELLRLSGNDLKELLETHPNVREILLAYVARREAENAHRLTASGLLI